MSETKRGAYTQGPWHIGTGNGEGSIFADSGRMRLESGGTTLYPIAQVNRAWEATEDEANARLIAKAPEMAEALRFCVEALAVEASGLYAAHIEQARRILAEIEGGAE